MRIPTALIALLATGVATADPLPWMKQDSPNELGVVLRVGSDCPQVAQHYSDVVSGVLTRSRIAVDETPALVLYFDLQCFDLTRANIAAPGFYGVGLDVTFGRYTSDGLMLFADTSYGNTGVGDNTGIRNAIREATENAITDYLKANFDL